MSTQTIATTIDDHYKIHRTATPWRTHRTFAGTRPAEARSQRMLTAIYVAGWIAAIVGICIALWGTILRGTRHRFPAGSEEAQNLDNDGFIRITYGSLVAFAGLVAAAVTGSYLH